MKKVKKDTNKLYDYVCMLCANPYKEENLIYTSVGCSHKSCLKERINNLYENLTDNEIDFLVDTEIKEYSNYRKEKVREKCMNNILNCSR